MKINKLLMFVATTILSGSIMFAESNIDELIKTKKPLKFNDDGTFRVLVISDIHATEKTIPKHVQDNIKLLVDRENPNLVILCGDNTRCMDSEEKLRSCLTSMVGYIEEKDIPWAHVYGNHDHEYAISKEEQSRIYSSYDWCITENGPEDLFGVGNCVLPVKSSKSDKLAFNVWLLDSGAYISGRIYKGVALKVLPFEGSKAAYYDFIKFNQIRWYVETSETLEKHNGAKIPGLMAFHMPLHEGYFGWQNRAQLEHDGVFGDNAVHAPPVNSGLFTAMLERGDIKAIANGHDHKNTTMVNYVGVKFCFVGTPSTMGYHDKNLLGGRVFIANENSPDEIKTYMSYINPEAAAKVEAAAREADKAKEEADKAKEAEAAAK